MSEPLLQVENLQAGYGDMKVLHGLDVTVEAGEIVALLGANGAGKSTFLRALSGLIPRKGSVQFEGEEIGRHDAAAIVARGVAHVPEGRGTFSDLTVWENLRVGALPRRSRPAEVHARAEGLLELFPILRERATQHAGLLSGGEQQMLAIARALMSHPRLLLLDEPSLGLAPTVTESVFAMLARLHKDEGISVLVVEQNAQLSLQIASRAYVIEAGRIQAHGPAEEIEQDAKLRQAYLGY